LALQRPGGRHHLVCRSQSVVDKPPMMGLSEPPAAELDRSTLKVQRGEHGEQRTGGT